MLLLAITISCQLITEESEKTGILVEKLLLSNHLRGKVKSELKYFSTQMDKMKVDFKADGLLSLNFNFLYSIIGLIVTYVIVMAQLS
jgi:uncharacterized protein YpuA (DUF1002 family)